MISGTMNLSLSRPKVIEYNANITFENPMSQILTVPSLIIKMFVGFKSQCLTFDMSKKFQKIDLINQEKDKNEKTTKIDDKTIKDDDESIKDDDNANSNENKNVSVSVFNEFSLILQRTIISKMIFELNESITKEYLININNLLAYLFTIHSRR